MRRELIVLIVALFGLVAANPTGDKSSNPCDIKGHSLRTVEDLDRFVERANAAGSGCEPNVVEALNAMKEIVDDPTPCTMRKAEAITSFVETHLKGSGDAIPKALADFAIAYGMQVSGACSQEMVKEFSEQADARLYEKLGPENYDMFRRFKQFLIKDSSIGKMLEPLIKTGEVILPVDLMEVIPDVHTKLRVYVSSSEFFNDVDVLCRNVLRPLYEPRLLPLAHLIRVGFINKGNIRKKSLKENGRFWSTAVFLCETLKLVEVEERDTPEQAAIEAELGQAADSYQKEESDEAETESEAGQVMMLDDTPIEAPESSGKIGGKIVDSDVKSLIKGFKANQSEVERLRERIMRRGMRMMTSMFKKGKYDYSIKELLNLIKVKEGEDSEKFEEAKRALVESINSPEAESSAYKATALAPSNQVNKHELKAVAPGRFIWRAVMAPVAFIHLVLITILSVVVWICAGGKTPEPFREVRDGWHQFMMTITGWGRPDLN